MDTHSESTNAASDLWPTLPLEAWQETYATLHLWTQIVGKVQTALSAPINHWWHSALHVTPRGLTTAPIPYGARIFAVRFDFLDHILHIETSDGARSALGLFPRSVAEFYHEFLGALRALGLEVEINPLPQELPNPIPCDQDDVHAAYDPDYVQRFWRILAQADRLFRRFRARFIGKSSPVHFFWGSFDLAVTRFSGRRAPPRPGADRITREAYSHEVISCGFWPGTPGGAIQEAAFYAYAAPAPPGFAQAAIQPVSAYYNAGLGEFLLRYEDVRRAANPDTLVLDFLQSTYEAAADRAAWNRPELER
jgi:uncharacterized protein DUF5996